MKQRENLKNIQKTQHMTKECGVQVYCEAQTHKFSLCRKLLKMAQALVMHTVAELAAQALFPAQPIRGGADRRRGYVYLVFEYGPRTDFFKVGLTGRDNPLVRLGELQTANPRKLRMGYAEVNNMAEAEAALMAEMARVGFRGTRGGTEWFDKGTHGYDMVMRHFNRVVAMYPI